MKRRDLAVEPRPFWRELALAVAQPVAAAFCNTVAELVVRRLDAAAKPAEPPR